MRRDALLASAGWLTLRYSYRRLHDDRRRVPTGHDRGPWRRGEDRDALASLNPERQRHRRVVTVALSVPGGSPLRTGQADFSRRSRLAGWVSRGTIVG